VDPNNGQILAMASVPSFDDPNRFDFKAGNATTKLVSRGKMSSGNRSTDAEPDSSKVSRAQQVANDPRGAAYGHLIGQAERVQLEPRSFSDFTSRDSEYRRSTQQSYQLAEKKKKHHFLFF
jgi:cell division protein FtsI/penicillin-binding protein 2